MLSTSEPALRNVRLYGKLGAKFGRCFRMAVSSPAEAVRALCYQLPGFEEYILNSEKDNVGYACFLGKEGLTKEQLRMRSEHKDIRIAPMNLGAKKQGVGQIIIGIILIVIAVVADYFTAGAFSTATGDIFYQMGIAMIIGGVIQLLTPQPKARERDKDTNYSFSGPVNTTAQGHPVPLLYGRTKCGSAVVSAGIYVNGGTQTSTIVPVGGGFWAVVGAMMGQVSQAELEEANDEDWTYVEE